MYTMEYYPVLRTNSAIDEAWINLEYIMLSEISQSHETSRFHLNECLKQPNSQNQRVELWLPVIRGEEKMSNY